MRRGGRMRTWGGALAVALALMATLGGGGPAAAASALPPEVQAGVAAFNRQDFAEAVRHYSRALDAGRLSPRQRADAFNRRGVAWSRQGRVEQALADYTRAMEADPSLAQAFSNRGTLWATQWQFEKALRDHAQALELREAAPPPRPRPAN